MVKNLMIAKISAIGDEISPHFGKQLSTLRKENIKYIELRTLNSCNIIKFDKKNILKIKYLLSKSGLKVSSLATPIGVFLISL